MKLRSLACAIAFGCTALLASHAHAGSGSFNILSYNVAETPTAYNGSSDAHSKVISCYIRQFNIVNVQEDFLWHAALYDTCDNHPYRTRPRAPRASATASIRSAALRSTISTASPGPTAPIRTR
jgi:hypothetical protein